MSLPNLDLECALAAGRIGQEYRNVKKQEIEGLCTDTAGVLAESGPYVMFLYLWSRRDKDKASGRLCVELYRHICRTLDWNAGSTEDNRCSNRLRS